MSRDSAHCRSHTGTSRARVPSPCSPATRAPYSSTTHAAPRRARRRSTDGAPPPAPVRGAGRARPPSASRPSMPSRRKDRSASAPWHQPRRIHPVAERSSAHGLTRREETPPCPFVYVKDTRSRPAMARPSASKRPRSAASWSWSSPRERSVTSPPPSSEARARTAMAAPGICRWYSSPTTSDRAWRPMRIAVASWALSRRGASAPSAERITRAPSSSRRSQSRSSEAPGRESPTSAR